VTNVAHELGFWDTPHFTRSFRKVMGCAPREYRARVSTGYSQLG
jgi:AraC-like DNA-binding protein